MSPRIEWESLAAGTHRLNCPACGRERRSDKTLGVTVDAAGAGVAHCFRCAYVETHRPDRPSHQRQQPARRREPVQRVAVETAPQHEALSPQGRALWRASHPIEPGTRPVNASWPRC